nr:MAG TPA: hypothetical protein [Caudoviricetes sp.]
MEKRNGNKQENEVGWMKLLDKLTKWFFKTAIEVNVDWREVALDLNRELIAAQEENQILYQRIADLEKLLEV